VQVPMASGWLMQCPPRAHGSLCYRSPPIYAPDSMMLGLPLADRVRAVGLMKEILRDGRASRLDAGRACP
jgi:hypothetical protein